jgi:hypothetical protein
MKIKQHIHKKNWISAALLSVMIISFPQAEAFGQHIGNSFDQQEQKTEHMKKILVIGIDPNTIDFLDPELVPGLTVEKIEAGMKMEQEKLLALGFETQFFLLGLNETDVSGLIRHLKQAKYDGIVIGAGVRVPQKTFVLFEKIINAVHEYAPGSRIVFNTLPTTTAEAIQRWLQ